MDYLGLNYYTRITVKGTDTASLPQLSSISNFDPLTLEPWEDYSKGIYEIQMFVKDRYAIPMMITETGTDGAPDEGRIESWLVRHLEWTKRAIKDGADVRGFFYWSLTDNYEWNHGMGMKFGLYGIANNGPKTRTPRSAVATYKQIIKQGDISAELLTKFPPE
jgi:beta-glucosidase